MVGSVLLFVSVAVINVAHADTVGPITFSTSTYSLGSVNGQNGWSATGPYDEAIVNTSDFGSPAGFGQQALRVSDAVTSGSFGDWIFASPLTDSVGETSSTNGAFSPGTKQNHFEMQFDIAVASSTPQPGLEVSVAPDRGDGSRMSYLRFEDSASGINVFFDDVEGTTNPATFVETQIATNLDRTVPHTIKLTFDAVDGVSNDIVKVYIDGTLVHTGTSWENYYWYDSEASAEQSPRIVKTMIIQARGAAHPADAGYGFLFDNISLTSSEVIPDTIAPVVTVTPAPGSTLSGTTTFTINVTDNNPLDPTKNKNVWVYLYNNGGAQKSKGANVDLSNGTGTFTVDTTLLDNGSSTLDVGKVFDAAGNPSGSGDNYFKNYDIENVPPSPSVPTLISPVNGDIEPTNDFYFTWNPSTETPTSTITYEFHSSMNPAETDGVLTTGLWDSGTLTTSSIHSTGAPDGTWYWQVRAIDASGTMSAWSPVWAMTIDTAPTPALTTCPAGTFPSLVETDTVDSASDVPTVGTNSLANGQQYLLVASGTWDNGGFNFVDPAYASVDSWTTYMQGYNIAPYLLGSNEFKLQLDGQFVNWGSYQPSHAYSYLYTGTGNPINLLVFDGDATAASPAPDASFYGDNTGTLSVDVYACGAPVYVTTDAPTGITMSDAMLNGTNDDYDAAGHSFWVSTSTFSTSTPVIPVGVYSTPDLGAIASGTPFSASLSSLTTDAVVHGQVAGTMPAIQPGVTYYYVAWSDVDGTWYPGAMQSFTTALPTYVTTDPATNVGQFGATVNGTNGSTTAENTSFWWGTTPAGPFDAGQNATEFPATGWSHDSGLGAAGAGGAFSESLSNLAPDTTYYFVAWSEIGGEWYPGAVESFTTLCLNTDDTLSALGVSAGALDPSFDPGTTAYDVILPFNTNTVPTVTATTTDPNATEVITQATSTTGTATVAVTAQDSSTTQDYTVTFSLAPATTSFLNVVVNVDNSASGTATSSDFTVNVLATHPSPTSTFPGSASGTTLTIDPNTPYYVNVSGPSHYNETTNGQCDSVDGVMAGDIGNCVVTETYHADGNSFFSSPFIVIVGSGPFGGHGGEVLGASTTGQDALEQEIAALQQQLLLLLEQYLGTLQGHGSH